jgi:hypothetical protein
MGMSLEVAQEYGALTDGVNNGKVAWEGGRALSRRGKVFLQEVVDALVPKG